MSATRRHGLAGPARLCSAGRRERLRQATAVLRAAVEAEAHLDQPRFEAFDHQPSMLIASAPAWADYARQLGAAADACALADPLLPPSRVLETLEGVPLPRTAALGPFRCTGRRRLPCRQHGQRAYGGLDHRVLAPDNAHRLPD
jgi:hypothetical protein